MSTRILHVFRAPLGGLFRHVVDLTKAQVERGYDVGIFCDAMTGGERAKAVLNELAPSLSLGVTRVPIDRNPSIRDLTALLSLRGLVAKVGPTVLHGHGSKGGAFARVASFGMRQGPIVRGYTPHGGSFNYRPGTWIHGLYMSAERFLAGRTDVFLFESDYIARRFRESVGPTDRTVRIVPNGISEAEFAPVERAQDPFDLVYVGELRSAKGVDTLLDALALLRHERGQRLTLLVVGSGPDEGELKARARERGIWDSVAFVPPQPIRGALERGAVMVIPSYAESLPYVILEAAAAAQPLVATNVGGIPEIFGPYADVLVPPRHVGALADAILRKLDEPPEVRAEKARALSEYVRCRFSLRGMVDGVLEGYVAAFAARAPFASNALVPPLSLP